MNEYDPKTQLAVQRTVIDEMRRDIAEIKATLNDHNISGLKARVDMLSKMVWAGVVGLVVALWQTTQNLIGG